MKTESIDPGFPNCQAGLSQLHIPFAEARVAERAAIGAADSFASLGQGVQLQEWQAARQEVRHARVKWLDGSAPVSS